MPNVNWADTIDIALETHDDSLQNSTQRIGGHSVHQWAYLWWSGINCGGPKKYVNDQNDLIMISKGNATWNTTENLNHQTVLNFETCFMCLEQYLGNVNFQNTELIAGLSDQQRQLFCWTGAVFAGLGHRSTRLFRRLRWTPLSSLIMKPCGHSLRNNHHLCGDAVKSLPIWWVVAICWCPE